ncbi:MAG: prephenate dehydratase [Burkholderiales bacterium]|jgi:chorismate mutase/prephenate dehydratase|tara:strand:+ start:4950 stop:6011 length:1062 start_codon:yes stop_codon:yes gene_type:complete
MSDQISDLRQHIDAIDDSLLDLLNKRAEIARQVGEAKKQGVVYRPEREAQVHRRLHAKNSGPLSNDTISHLFTEVISSCRAQEELLTVACLGPAGTFSEEAVLKQFGSQIKLIYCSTIDEVFKSVGSDVAAYGVVPLENSTEGAISRTLDLLFESPLKLCGEIGLPVRHNLLSKEKPENIEKIYSHSQSLSQCQKWLGQHFPSAQLIPVASNAAAAKLVATEARSAAIAGRIAGEHFGLTFIHSSIEDKPDNTTRFGVVSKSEVGTSGSDKTSIVLAAQHKPGAILGLLEPLAENGISMTRLESRPSGLGLWEYMFFIDLEGHKDDEVMQAALSEIQSKSGFFKILGSYPKTV